MHIGVLGAGIIGLNTALRLQAEFPNAQLSLIADKFEAETLSHVAAGIFRPGTSFAGPSAEITQTWIRDSYEYYDRLLRSADGDRAGIFQTSGYIFASQHRSLTRNKFLEQVLPAYREASPEELQLCPGSWKYGSYFTTMVIESGDFLPWARSTFEAGGGTVRPGRLESFQDLGTGYDAIFNCTGFGAKWLCEDPKLVPLRGQVLKVRAPWVKMFFYGDYDTYIVPGRHLVTLGGTRQLDSYNESPDPHDTAAIWERCTGLLPALAKGTVVKTEVGLRPHRDPVRVQLEEIPIGPNSTRLKVVHEYGHGGYGVTVGPGSAVYAVELLKESLRARPSLSCQRSKL